VSPAAINKFPQEKNMEKKNFTIVCHVYDLDQLGAIPFPLREQENLKF